MNQQWSKDLLTMVQKLNNFIYSENSSQKLCIPFYILGKRVGLLTKDVTESLKNYPDVFEFRKADTIFNKEYVALCDKYSTFNQRTEAVEQVVKDLKKKNAHISLQGWRNEYYEVFASATDKPLMKLERAAVTMFGIKACGSHMNGYVNHPVKGVCLWIARRSKSKQTFPGMLDNMVAGGIASGIGIFETLVKECQEEAGIPEALAKKAVPVGMISYIYEDERGIQDDVQYCFDLEVPLDFVPVAVDGEVEEFKLYTIEEVKQLIVTDDFKVNCAAVTLDFLIRKGYVSPDETPDYVELLQLLHFRF